MGCGRVFEGSHQQMYDSMKKIKSLPKNSSIYCGHEDSLQNAKFAASIEPNNQQVQARLKEIERNTNQDIPSLPTKLELEIKTNPFLRYDSLDLKKALKMESSSEELVFSEIRTRKDNF